MGTPWRLRPGTVSPHPGRSAERHAVQGDALRTVFRATGATRSKSSGPSRSAGPRPLRSERQVRLRRPRRAPTVQDAAVGSVRESREDHIARHGGGLRTCPRCRWHTRGGEWVCSYGMFVRPQGSRTRENVAWLAERPTRFGGEWGLGCIVCAWFANRARTDLHEKSCGSRAPQPQRGAARRCRLGSRFARFEVRAEFLQAEHFKQHAVSAVHRRAVMAWINPDAPLTFAAQRTLGDEQLLSGAVPQPADWLRSWRACITPQSWQAASKHLETEHYVHMLRARPVQPSALQQMARI